MNSETEYRIVLVPNGSRMEFFNRKFAGRDCKVLWTCDTLEEVMSKFREFAIEEATKEGRVTEIEGMMPKEVIDGYKESDDGYDAYQSAFDAAVEKFADRCMDAMSIEWDGDLKWLHVIKCDGDGNIMEIL